MANQHKLPDFGIFQVINSSRDLGHQPDYGTSKTSMPITVHERYLCFFYLFEKAFHIKMHIDGRMVETFLKIHCGTTQMILEVHPPTIVD